MEIPAKENSTLDNNQGQKIDQGEKFVPEKSLISWVAPSRPFKRRDREFWISTIAIAGVAGLVFFLVEGFMPVILIIALVFLFYVLSTVEPENIEYKLTNKGIRVAEHLTVWGIIGRHWFSRRYNSKILIFETSVVPGRLALVILEKDKEALKSVLSSYSLEEEIPPSKLDRAANWFSDKLPGN